MVRAPPGYTRTVPLFPDLTLVRSLETLEEVAQRYAEQFQRAGGSALRYIPALNADGTHLDFLAAWARRQFAGQTAPGQADPQAAGPERIAMLEREIGRAHV